MPARSLRRASGAFPEPHAPSRRLSQPPAQPVAASAITVSMSPTPAPVIVGGNGTDKALLAWAASLGQGAEARDAFVPVHSIPFSSVTKQAVSVQTGTSDGVSVVFVKGAPDALIPRCSHFASDGADPSPLTEDTRAAFDAALDALGRQGKRVLALCERVLPRAEFPPGFAFSSDPEPNFPLDGLTLLGLVAIADPPRPSTAPAVAELRIAGIRVAMVTGDAETTAEAIARQVRLEREKRAGACARIRPPLSSGRHHHPPHCPPPGLNHLGSRQGALRCLGQR